jgi:Cd2+/Zn2+-exporting ATPase
LPEAGAKAAFLASAFLAGFSVFKSAFLQAKSRVFFTMEVLMTLATAGAIVIGQTEEAAAVVVLFGIGQILEEFASRRARKGIANLLSRAPRTALLREGDKTREIPAAEIVRGQLLEVLPGSMVPTDGVILEGTASFDESVLTGESRPVQHAVNDQVIAGSIALDGRVQIEASAAYIENTYSRIIRLVEESAKSKGTTQRFVESFAAKYTPGVMLLALAVMLAPLAGVPGGFEAWFYKGLAVLLIGCPCALVISIPAAVTSAISRASRMGVLVKGGETLEALGKIETAFFDKTGTVTEGKIRVVEVQPTKSGLAGDALLSLAGSVESASSHPIATAIVAEAKKRALSLLPVTEATAAPGRGVAGRVDSQLIEVLSPTESARRAPLASPVADLIAAAEGKGFTVVLVHEEGVVLGAIALSDTVRGDSSAVLETLGKELGIHAIMLTGDNAAAAKHIADGLGIEAHARCLPEDKTRFVREAAKNQVVAMVGDGINDAPALAAAHVSVAMGTGTDVAMETASVVLARGSLTGLLDAIRLSRDTRRIIGQNVAFALGLKAIFLGLTFAGVATLWMAIVADTGATLLVTMNALRLLRSGRNPVTLTPRSSTV